MTKNSINVCFGSGTHSIEWDYREKKTTDDYWECECEYPFIHHVSEKECKRCGVSQSTQPKAELASVIIGLMNKDK